MQIPWIFTRVRAGQMHMQPYRAQYIHMYLSILQVQYICILHHIKNSNMKLSSGTCYSMDRQSFSAASSALPSLLGYGRDSLHY